MYFFSNAANRIKSLLDHVLTDSAMIGFAADIYVVFKMGVFNTLPNILWSFWV